MATGQQSGGDGSGGGSGGTGGGQGGGTGGAGGSGAWLDAFPAVKGNADLVGQLSSYEGPEAALLDLTTKGWGPKWREQYAGADQAKLAELARFQTPQAALDSLFNSKQRIREGLLAKPLPANPNEQEVASYREAQGIPSEAKGYLETLPKGVVLGEEDKPTFESLAAKLHTVHTPPRVAAAIVEWYNGHVQEQQEAIAEQDSQDREAAETELRQQWGGDYKANKNILSSYLTGLPPAVKDAIENARDIDGKGLLNNPGVMQWLIGMVREVQDVSTLLLDTSSGAGKAVESRIAEIEGIMRTDRPRYNKDAAMQAELENLYGQRAKIQGGGRERAA
jgi:hypothetical protein